MVFSQPNPTQRSYPDSISLHLSKKGLLIAYLNVNRLLLVNKVDEVSNVVQNNNLHVLAITGIIFACACYH